VKPLLALLVLILAACEPSLPNEGAPNADEWHFREGPNGLRCVFYKEGQSTSAILGMDCDWSDYAP
jgi:hypothetical protein